MVQQYEMNLIVCFYGWMYFKILQFRIKRPKTKIGKFWQVCLLQQKKKNADPLFKVGVNEMPV